MMRNEEYELSKHTVASHLETMVTARVRYNDAMRMTITSSGSLSTHWNGTAQ